MAVEFFEDCRIETLLMPRISRPAAHLPGPAPEVPLRGRLRPGDHVLPAPPPGHAVTRLLDPDHGYVGTPLNCSISSPASTPFWPKASSNTEEIAHLALSYVAKHPPPERPARHWSTSPTPWWTTATTTATCGSTSKKATKKAAFDAKQQAGSHAEEVVGLPPRPYPEWDHHSQTYRPDWVSVYERLHPSAATRPTSTACSRSTPRWPSSLKRMLDLLKPQDKVRIRYQEEGSELDLDVAIRSADRLQERGRRPTRAST
jgi:nitric oxide reductase NorD protein